LLGSSLAAYYEALYEWLGQPGGAHARLNLGNIVRDPPEFNDLVLEISDSETRARIAIARLPNRPGIE
jgi:hypothetical protein